MRLFCGSSTPTIRATRYLLPLPLLVLRILANHPDDSAPLDDLAYLEEVREVGPTLVSRCPFHGDEGTSLSVSPAEQRFGCPVCGAKGDVIQFLLELEVINRDQAIEKLEAQNDT